MRIFRVLTLLLLVLGLFSVVGTTAEASTVDALKPISSAADPSTWDSGDYLLEPDASGAISDTLSGYLAGMTSIKVTYSYGSTMESMSVDAFGALLGGGFSGGATLEVSGSPLSVTSSTSNSVLPVLAQASLDAATMSVIVVIKNLSNSVLSYQSVFEAIVGSGCGEDVTVSYLISPVPLPASAGLFFFGLLVLGVVAYRKKNLLHL